MIKKFDHIANQYDTDFTFSKIGKLQRNLVYVYLKNLPNNLNILELNCGTGQDAIWFAYKGNKVLATDISKKMIGIAKQKVTINSLEFKQLDINKIDKLIVKNNTKKFDLIFSNFGGLNCLSPKEMKQFFKSASQILTKNGKLILVIMPKNTLWERFYFIIKGQFKTAFRRNTKNSLQVNVGGKNVKTWYFNPKEIKEFSNPFFEISKTKPIGFFIPPSYLSVFFNKHSLLLSILNLFEKLIGKFGFLSPFSDHYLIELNFNYKEHQKKQVKSARKITATNFTKT